ncbi:MAG: hypothetical protein NTX79_08165 [Candidatus Micrarchaeota archaeon]|nr:hypothetical protein [Candidatus Micrarchaeota archaeon]
MSGKKTASMFRLLLFASIALAAAAGSLHAATASPNLSYFWLALLIPTFIVAIAYMASYAFNTPSLRAILQDELLQILATGAVALTLVGTQLVVDQYVVATLQASGAAGSNIDGVMAAAADKINSLSAGTASVLQNMQDVSMALGKEASKGVFCNFMGVGFSLSNCSPFNAYRGSLTASAFTSTVALSDTAAQSYLLSLARNFGFTVIIPLGLLLRCFRASRGAGGALIAIGFGFYTVYPAVILATDNLLHNGTPPNAPSIPKVGACDPMETSVSTSLSEFTDYGDQLTDYTSTKALAYFVLVRVLFLSILNLIITLGFIRMFANMIGSDIDVSSLARIS